MTTAIVLSGGGSLGSAQAGMLCALADHGVVPDLLVGTSVGAINGAFIAGSPGQEGSETLAAVWRSVRRSDVFPVRPAAVLAALAGRTSHLVPDDKLRRLLRQYVTYTDLKDAHCPVRIVATDVRTGREAVFSRGPVVDAVMASIAVPGVLPPVRVADQDLMDGSVANNTPISIAVREGASTIYVLHPGYACALPALPRSALSMALHALSVVLQQRLIADVLALGRSTRLRVVPPLCPLEISPGDFGHNGELVDRARESTRRWLEAGMPGDPAEPLRLHTHG
jgi:NTE family protein